MIRRATPHGRLGALAAIAAVSAAIATFGFMLGSVDAGFVVPPDRMIRGGAALMVVATAILAFRLAREASFEAAVRLASLSLVVAGLWFFLLTVAYQIASMLRVRVDLLSYSESGFLNDIVRMTRGLPIYAPPLENQSTVYTPGSPLLTWRIASLFGDGLDVRTLRLTQFSYVIVAAITGTCVADRLARLLAPAAYADRWLWRLWWFPALLMVATEPRFNTYTPSLNSDGLALAMSIGAFLIVAQHAYRPRPWLLALMIVWPALGFFAKQNMLAWSGVFALYLLVSGSGLMLALGVGAAAGAAGLAAMGGAYWMWGPDFWFWAVTSYAPKTISVARTFQHLLGAGGYLAMGLAAGWLLLRQSALERRVLGIWVAWLALMLLQAYTSGFAWAANHLGPSAVMAVVWLAMVALVSWPRPEAIGSPWRLAAAQIAAAGVLVGVFSGLGFARPPVDPVPADLERYVRAIEREFEGQDASKILMDYGTWVYAARGIVVPDRGYATHVHLEPNQPITHGMLAGTIDRISRGTYDKILVRELDSGRSSYDFNNRGSGLREAIHSHYREVRRIPAVDVERWWPRHMLDEIQVFVRNPSADAPTEPSAPSPAAITP